LSNGKGSVSIASTNFKSPLPSNAIPSPWIISSLSLHTVASVGRGLLPPHYSSMLHVPAGKVEETSGLKLKNVGGAHT
jgi:hypothetical protein